MDFFTLMRDLTLGHPSQATYQKLGIAGGFILMGGSSLIALFGLSEIGKVAGVVMAFFSWFGGVVMLAYGTSVKRVMKPDTDELKKGQIELKEGQDALKRQVAIHIASQEERNRLKDQADEERHREIRNDFRAILDCVFKPSPDHRHHEPDADRVHPHE